MTAGARLDNVLFIDFCPAAPPPAAGQEDPWWPWEGGPVGVAAPGEDPPAATRPVPARWSPRPCRVLRRRFARSRFAADLKEWAFLVGLLAAGVVLAALIDPSIDLTPAGGTP